MNKKEFLEKNNCILSGEYIIGILGEETNLIDSFGRKLFVGDIVITSNEKGYLQGLSAVVNLKYIYNINIFNMEEINDLVKIEDKNDFAIMGLKSIDFTGAEKSEWSIRRVKSYEEVVDGEHWKDFGFNYSIKK